MENDGYIGTLTDSLIIEHANRNELIVENFDLGCVKQACYELRAGNIYYDASDENKKYNLEDQDDYILLKPKQQIIIIVLEKLELPSDIMARIIAKGQLFSVGIIPVSTYADPGFIGRLGITFFNASNNYLKIKQGTPIAKIEFVKLMRSVEKKYSGQHGYETSIWPFQGDYILTKEEMRKDPRIGAAVKELECSYGSDFMNIIKSIRSCRNRIFFPIILYFFSILFIAIIVYSNDSLLNSKTWNNIVAIVLGIFSNIFCSVLFWMVNLGDKK